MTSKQTVDTIILNLEHGARVLVKDDYNNNCLFYPDKDEAGNFKRSCWQKTKNETKLDSNSSEGNLISDLYEFAEKDNWQIVDIYIPEYKRPAVGQLVRIKENAKEECEKYGVGWPEETNKMIGKKCEIKDYSDMDYKIYIPDKSDWFHFPRSAFELVLPDTEEPKTAILEKDGKRYEVQIIREI